MKLHTTHNLSGMLMGFLPAGVHVNTRHPVPVRSLFNRLKYVAACESALARAAHPPPRGDPETTRFHATQISAKAPPCPSQTKRDSLRRRASSTRAWLSMLEASTLISFSTTQLSAPLPRAAAGSVEASSAVTVAAAEPEPSAIEPEPSATEPEPSAAVTVAAAELEPSAAELEPSAAEPKPSAAVTVTAAAELEPSAAEPEPEPSSIDVVASVMAAATCLVLLSASREMVSCLVL